MYYRDKEYCFSDEEIADIMLCLREYETMIKLLLNDKNRHLSKIIKKLYKERLDFFEFLFLNVEEVKKNVEFKKEIE